MYRYLILLLFGCLGNQMFSQDIVLEDSWMNNLYEYLTPADVFCEAVYKSKGKGELLATTDDTERFFIYANRYFNDYPVYKGIRNEELRLDSKRIGIGTIGFTEEEYECFREVILGNIPPSECKALKYAIQCKINVFVFNNISNVFVGSNGKQIERLHNRTIEFESYGNENIRMEFSQEGVLKKVMNLDESYREVKMYDECGTLDEKKTIRNETQLSSIQYFRTKNRDWDGRKRYFRNGSLFSEVRKRKEEDYYFSYQLDRDGDTLSYIISDYRGDLSTFYSKSYSRNRAGEISSKNDSGTVYYYTLERDSIVSKETYKNSSCLFCPLKKVFPLSTEKVVEMEVAFQNHFFQEWSNVEECREQLVNELSKVIDRDSIDMMPYIDVTCDMLLDTFEVKRRLPRNYAFDKEDLLLHYKHFGGKIDDIETLEFIYQYFAIHAQMRNGEWKYYVNLLPFMRDKISKQDLYILYKSMMSDILGVATYSNYKTNQNYKDDYHKLREVIDTLGNTFREMKSEVRATFIKTLDPKERAAIQEVGLEYTRAIERFLEKFIALDRNRCYGLEKNRMNYFKLLTQWLLRHPNEVAFNQNFRGQLPEGFETILQKFEGFISEEDYAQLSKAEDSMLDYMKEKEYYLLPPYNPYPSANDARKRKQRRFNWLIE
ncbi:MAG: hypothetical protein P1U56_11165 [Saprospiraceae bacterium]|nr:hypothetical protein [Saprospiraceae bacterium]